MSYELYYYSTAFDFEICLRTREVAGTFEKRAPALIALRQSREDVSNNRLH